MGEHDKSIHSQILTKHLLFPSPGVGTDPAYSFEAIDVQTIWPKLKSDHYLYILQRKNVLIEEKRSAQNLMKGILKNQNPAVQRVHTKDALSREDESGEQNYSDHQIGTL